jgi:hypothetical protein
VLRVAGFPVDKVLSPEMAYVLLIAIFLWGAIAAVYKAAMENLTHGTIRLSPVTVCRLFFIR